jgi:hypothetical protein
MKCSPPTLYDRIEYIGDDGEQEQEHDDHEAFFLGSGAGNGLYISFVIHVLLSLCNSRRFSMSL